MFVKENPDRKKKSRGKWRIYFRLYYAYYQQIDRVVVSGNGHIHKIKKSSLVRWIHLTKKAIYNHVYNIFRLFWWLCKFSFHNKWNEAWLLVINWYIPVTSRVAERLKAYQENLKTADNYCLLLSPFCLLLSPSTNKNLLKNRNWTFPCSALFHMKTRVCLKYFGNGYFLIFLIFLFHVYFLQNNETIHKLKAYKRAFK